MTSASSPERWQALQDVIDGALDLAPPERSAFLRTACAGDLDLLAAAQRLLAACERAENPSGLLGGTALTLAAPMLEEIGAREAALEEERRAAALLALRTALAGRYDVRREIGRGGMATVYLAHDPRHERDVAIKVFEQSLDPGGTARFLREIRISARLTHPHLLGIHDSGAAAGFLYFVMPLMPGETLRAQLTREGPLPLADAIRLLREMADALAYAHAQGVVHRDLKPENVLLSGGHAVVADFGIARALAAASADDMPAADASATSHETHPSATLSLGAPAYMAPEQATGAADHRTDLYALGIVAYEMLTGTHPPRTPVLTGEPQESLRSIVPDLPPWLAQLVQQLLEPDPCDRPPDAAAVIRDIDAGTTTPESAPPRRRRALQAVIALVALAAAGVYAGTRLGDAPATPAAPVQTVAVLPFTAQGSGYDDVSDGISEELAYTLGRLPGLRIAGTTSTRVARQRGLDTREIGRTLGVDIVVTGEAASVDGRLRVNAAAVRIRDGATVWKDSYDHDVRQLAALQDEIAGAVAAALLPAAPAREYASDRGTTDLAAYTLYMQGRFLFLERGGDNVTRAIAHFREAVARDPGFARAHAALAIAYGVLPSYVPGVTDSTRALLAASARRAAALDSTLADAHVALGIVHENALQFDAAVARYRRAIELEPSNVMPYHALGFLLRSMGRTDEALLELQRAARLDPLAKSVATARAGALNSLRRFSEAAAEARRALALDPTFPLGLGGLGAAQAFGGEPDSAIVTLQRALELHPQQPGFSVLLMYALAAAGRWNDVVAVRDALASLPGASRVHIAAAELILGNRAPILDLLTTPEGQALWLNETAGFGCDPLLDPLWSEPRFVAAMRELGVASCEHARPWPFTPPAGVVSAQ